MATATERCPWCGSVITHAKFLQVQNAIREEERRKLAEAERALRARLESELTKKFAAAQQKLAKERAAIDAERAKLEAAVKKQIELVQHAAEKQRLRDLGEVRRALQKDREAALLKKEMEFARERDALQKKISEMSRRVGKKAAADVAEGADLDLHEELRAAFPEDRITRVTRLGYLQQEVRYKGDRCGTILIDARPRGAWQQAFVKNLRRAQNELEADHAILATGVFPAGRKELFLDSGVLVVAPARVVVVVELLRRAMIAMHVARLSEAERTDKLSQLFRFMTSSGFKRKLTEAESLAAEALELDVQEKRAHDNTWKKRGQVLTRIRHVLREIDTDVSAIVEARDESQLSESALMAVRSPSSRVH